MYILSTILIVSTFSSLAVTEDDVPFDHSKEYSEKDEFDKTDILLKEKDDCMPGGGGEPSPPPGGEVEVGTGRSPVGRSTRQRSGRQRGRGNRTSRRRSGSGETETEGSTSAPLRARRRSSRSIDKLRLSLSCNEIFDRLMQQGQESKQKFDIIRTL